MTSNERRKVGLLEIAMSDGCRKVGDANANAGCRRVEDPPNKKQRKKKGMLYTPFSSFFFCFFLVSNIFFYLFLGSSLLITQDCDERRA